MENNKREAAISIFKSGLSNIPFIGQLFTEVLFEYNGRIKQNRINDFVEILMESVSNSSPEFSIEKIKSEDFGDLLENVFRKVAFTKSKEKLVSFKNILFKGLKDNSQINRCEIFAQLLSQVSNKHIEILTKHKNILYNNNSQISLTRKRELSEEHYKLQEEIKNEILFSYPDNQSPVPALKLKKEKVQSGILEIETLLKKHKQFRISGYYQLSKGDYLFYLQDLASKALLIDEGVGGIGTESYEIMKITELGLDFLSFIEES